MPPAGANPYGDFFARVGRAVSSHRKRFASREKRRQLWLMLLGALLLMMPLSGALVLGLIPAYHRSRLLKDYEGFDRGINWRFATRLELQGTAGEMLDHVRRPVVDTIVYFNNTPSWGMPELPYLFTGSFWRSIGRRITGMEIHRIPENERDFADLLRSTSELERLTIDMSTDYRGGCFVLMPTPSPYEADSVWHDSTAAMLTVLTAIPDLPLLRELQVDGLANYSYHNGWAEIVARCSHVERLAIGSHTPSGGELMLLAGMPSLKELRLPHNTIVPAGTLRRMREINPALRIRFRILYAEKTTLPGEREVIWWEMDEASGGVREVKPFG